MLADLRIDCTPSKESEDQFHVRTKRYIVDRQPITINKQKFFLQLCRRQQQRKEEIRLLCIVCGALA